MNFKTFCLLLIILLCAVFIYIKAQTLGSETSGFNQTTRYTLGKHPFLRQLFSLHKDGDARNQFMSTNKIIIDVAQISGGNLEDRTLEQFAKEVKAVTGKEVELFNIDTIRGGKVSELDLQNLEQRNRRHFDGSSANLFVLYVEDFESQGSEVGKTYREFGMVLSDRRLKDLTQNFSASLSQYQLSTMLHEFGHQLGLDHNNRTACIMNNEVEEPQRAVSFSGQLTPTEFCNYELEQLQSLKMRSN